MSRNRFGIVVLSLLLVLGVSCRKERVVTEAMLEQARQTVGVYDVTGDMTLSAISSEPEGKTLDFSGVAMVVDTGNAVLYISYISDKTGDTNSITAEVEEDGSLKFKNLSFNYEGVKGKLVMDKSDIRRYGDTVAGSASCTIWAYVRRDCDMTVQAIRRHYGNW